MQDCYYDGHGINRVIRNAQLRDYKSDTVSTELEKLDTKLVQKIGGFTSENPVDFYTESGANGKYKVNTNDYNVHLYSAPPRNIINVLRLILKELQQVTVLKVLLVANKSFTFTSH